MELSRTTADHNTWDGSVFVFLSLSLSFAEGSCFSHSLRVLQFS